MRNLPRYRHSLLFLVLSLILTAIPAYAAPIVTGPFLFTENYGPNGVGVPPGYYLAIGAQVQDSGGVPGNIESVDAFGLTPDQTTYHLPFIDVPIFPGLYQAFPLPPYTGQLGQWRIEATNKQGEKGTALTPVLDKPLLIPLTRNLRFTVTGNPETPTIEWDPVLFDNDLDPLTPPVPVSQYRVRFVTTGNVQWSILRSGEVNLVIVGTDRTARNGDVANKIGTYPLAVLAACQQGALFCCRPPEQHRLYHCFGRRYSDRGEESR